jgi:hypothetical protein
VADEGAHRDPNKTIETLRQEGVDMFYHTYGESAEATRELLRGVHPDFGMYCCGSEGFGVRSDVDMVFVWSFVCLVVRLFGDGNEDSRYELDPSCR